MWIQGEVVIIDDNGITYDNYTTDTQLAVCSMEYIYFARPDSNIQGVNVHTARKRMGAQLAREFKHEADIVIGVPNSSLSAAMGFAEESGLPMKWGSSRTNIRNGPLSSRLKNYASKGFGWSYLLFLVLLKENALSWLMTRLYEARHLVALSNFWKKRGHQKYTLPSGSPALAYPCFYGIDIQTRQELIAANHTVEETRQIIGAD